jgi:predicted ArsR family transcriptional regulator
VNLLDFIPDPDPAALARATDPATSREAAANAVASGSVARHHARILAALARLDGLTSEEVAAEAGIDRHAAGRRMKELETAGLIRRGESRRSARSGRNGQTWWLVRREAA